MLQGLQKAMKIAKDTSEEFAGTSGEAHACMLIQERIEVYINEELAAMHVALGEGIEAGMLCPRCAEPIESVCIDEGTSYWCTNDEPCGWATLVTPKKEE
jgi:hypothetical protein